jgi:ribosomal-protein-alanine N-acetyltransferase
MKIELTPVDVDGKPRDFDHPLSATAREVLLATGALYDAVGFEEPWIGYLVVAGSQAVGTCGFKSPPLDGRVEIAYFTFPEYENRGLATQMAGQLIALAQGAAADVNIVAQTLPERNASTRVLEKSGFRRVGTVDHPEDGEVWEWQLPRGG